MRRKLGIIIFLVALTGAMYGQSSKKIRKHEFGFTLGYVDNLNEYVDGGGLGSIFYSYFINQNLGFGIAEYGIYSGISKAGDDYYSISY